MPEEIEVETKDLQETIDEIREEREERAKEAKEGAWTRFISLSTAFLAVIAAVAALKAGALVNEAILAKNNGVLRYTQASDQWNYYQAEGIKANIEKATADTLSATPALSAKSASHESEAARHKTKQADIKTQAEKLEKESQEFNDESKGLVEHHEIFAYCVTFAQVAIALSAIAALTKRKPVWYLSLLVGVGGMIFLVRGFTHTPQAPAEPEHAVEKAASGEHAAGSEHAAPPERHPQKGEAQPTGANLKKAGE